MPPCRSLPMRDGHEVVLVVLAKDAVFDGAAIEESQLTTSGRIDAQQLRAAAAAAAASKQQEVSGGVHDARSTLCLNCLSRRVRTFEFCARDRRDKQT